LLFGNLKANKTKLNKENARLPIQFSTF